jgi:serine/threonine protein kinase
LQGSRAAPTNAAPAPGTVAATRTAFQTDGGHFIPAGTLAQLRDVSLDFAPPEVVRALQAGKFQMKVEPSSDVWALGMVAYELLTRSRAFPSGMDQDEICDQITGKAPLPWEAEATKRDKLNKLKQLKPSVLRCGGAAAARASS